MENFLEYYVPYSSLNRESTEQNITSTWWLKKGHYDQWLYNPGRCADSPASDPYVILEKNLPSGFLVV